jgi:asparagine synthase (glutamine-hydrolysing)
MCGIAGLHQREGNVDLGRLRLMSELLRHRGPDDEGVVLVERGSGNALTLGGPDTPAEVLASPIPYTPGHWLTRAGSDGALHPAEAIFSTGLVHRRLAILDLSPGGHGPMCDRERRTWITYNGEVYNWIELRAELEALGERFATGCDVEVVLAAYRRWGHACLGRMNGMFAFALYDADRGELFCARDRFGVKPFYYQWDGRCFAFASEPKALVRTQPSLVRPRLEAVYDLVAYDWVDHEVETFFEGTRQLPGGHYLVVSADRFELRRWWSLDPRRRATGGAAAWEREFERLFTSAVELRLRADVDVGSCLSGGLDSSAVVVTAAERRERPIHTFTCAYDEGPAWDERPWVRSVTERTRAISHLVVPDGGDLWRVFERLTEAQDEPTAGPGLYSQWKVMELAHRAGLKVLLDGQGGDETLAGYPRYLAVRLRDLLIDGRLIALARMWGPVTDRLGVGATLSHTLEPWLPRRAVESLRRRFGQGKDRVLSPMLRSAGRRFAGRLPFPPRDFPGQLQAQLAFDTLTRLLPSLLRYEDRNSMAFSIETRLPFLDYRLVEFAFSLPDDQKLDGTASKAILRRGLAHRIPTPVLERRDKKGFETPIEVWLRRGHEAELRRRLLAPGPLHEWMNADVLRDELDDFRAGRRPIALQVWRWLSLEAWTRRFVLTDPRVPRRAGPASLGLDGFRPRASRRERHQDLVTTRGAA